jgi:glycosyltransferase involved in cell wall biosynthesis
MTTLVLALHFPPLGGGGVQRIVRFVKYAASVGTRVIVVTGPGASSDRWTPEDRTLLERIGSGVEIVRVPTDEPRARTGWARRGERMLGLSSRTDAWWVEAAVDLGRSAGRQADVILAEAVPYATARAAARLSAELGIPWVADLQDPWALDEMWLYPSALHQTADRRRMRKLLTTAATVVMNTPEASHRLVGAFPEFASARVVSIPNAFDSEDFTGPAPALGPNRPFSIVHSGYLHTEFGLQHRKVGRIRRGLGGMPVPGTDFLTRSHWFLVEALERLLRADPSLSDELVVHLAGSLTEVDRQVAARVPVIRLHGYLSHSATVALLRSADLLFLPMQKLPPGVRAGLVPGKTYEYLAARRPILGAVPEGDARELLAESGMASICEPDDVECIAEAIERRLQAWRAGDPPPTPNEELIARYDGTRLASALHEVVTQAGQSAARP